MAEKKVEATEKKTYDIKNTKEVLALGFAVSKMLLEAKKNDGKISAADLPMVVQLFPNIGPAIEDIQLVPAEIKDLDKKEIEELVVFTMAQFAGLTKPEILVKIEKGLALGVALAEFIATFKKVA